MGTLLTSAGKLLVRAGRFVYTTCAACCGNAGYYRACPCPRPPPVFHEMCVGLGPPTGDTDPPCVYVSTRLTCGSRPIRPGDVLLIDGVCYTVQAPIVVPPAGQRVIDPGYPYQCIDGGCPDPRCTTQPTSALGYAQPCFPVEGQGRLVFCRNQFPTCVVLGAADGIVPSPPCALYSPTAPPVTFLDPADRFIVRPPGANGRTSCCECAVASNDNADNCGTSLVYAFAGCNRGVLMPRPTTPTWCGCCTPNLDALEWHNCQVRVYGSWRRGFDNLNYELIDYDVSGLDCEGPASFRARYRRYENGVLVFDGPSELIQLFSFDRCHPPVPWDFDLGLFLGPPAFRPDYAVQQVCSQRYTARFSMTCDCRSCRLDYDDAGLTGYSVAERTAVQSLAPCRQGCAGSQPTSRRLSMTRVRETLRGDVDTAAEAIRLLAPPGCSGCNDPGTGGFTL